MSSDVRKTLKQRGARYGEFSGHADISQSLKAVMHKTDNWQALSNDKKEALEMIMHKVARVLNGDPEYNDNWHDIAGYSGLVEANLKRG